MAKRNIMEKAAIAQVSGRYGIAPHFPGGIITPGQLRKVADVAEKYQVDLIKLTSAQRISLLGIDEDRIDEAWEDLQETPGAAIGMCIRSIKFCPGTTHCPHAKQDAMRVGLELDRRFHAMPLPFKFKIGVSGCVMQCAENAIKDFALQGTKDGWKVQVGGSGGVSPRLSQEIASDLTDDEAIALCHKVVDLFTKENVRSRLGKWIDKIGIEAFKEKLDLAD